ncbi:MerR family transcriptional regulator [Terrilactibacillus sp. BCM23-1]|uniref:MerR family transcriptional regulator n=1 Tax=Terrilactibacillus tamarindi TaxID=2599694 RepID=A0A6N8CQS5_9BACI|nr:MerR family transcriptional regulator [Terrilactibacillus tamarindi]MTT31433.1 MerR family transcriptional regulator [Terrilactibacillus tamarindi]
MRKDLLLINQFSKLTGLSRKALYVYDQKNILNPSFIDPDNDYRYYNKNQLLTAKRIKLLKQAGFTLKEIEQIVDEKLSAAEINSLIERKLRLESDKIIKANQAIQQLNMLTSTMTEFNGEVKIGYLDAVHVVESSILPNENICTALNDAEKLFKKNNVIRTEKMIKYERSDNDVYPVAIAIQVKSQKLDPSIYKKYFDFEAQHFFCEVDPYQEQSILKIKNIIKNDKIKLSGPYIYERILNSDDYLYSSKRFSEFIFPLNV